MNRRGFLKALFAGAAAVAAAPAIAVAEKVVPKPVDLPCLPGDTELPEINLVIDSEDIVLRNRKLKAVWTMEAEQDLRCMHNFEAEQELTDLLAKELQDEIDREILGDLRNSCSLGYKGRNYMDSGYFYSPYAELAQTPVSCT